MPTHTWGQLFLIYLCNHTSQLSFPPWALGQCFKYRRPQQAAFQSLDRPPPHTHTKPSSCYHLKSIHILLLIVVLDYLKLGIKETINVTITNLEVLVFIPKQPYWTPPQDLPRTLNWWLRNVFLHLDMVQTVFSVLPDQQPWSLHTVWLYPGLSFFRQTACLFTQRNVLVYPGMGLCVPCMYL